jgi:hypothetical protein
LENHPPVAGDAEREKSNKVAGETCGMEFWVERILLENLDKLNEFL